MCLLTIKIEELPSSPPKPGFQKLPVYKLIEMDCNFCNNRFVRPDIETGVITTFACTEFDIKDNVENMPDFRFPTVFSWSTDNSHGYFASFHHMTKQICFTEAQLKEIEVAFKAFYKTFVMQFPRNPPVSFEDFIAS